MDQGRVVVITAMALLMGDGEVTKEKLIGLLLIVTGILFFNRVLHFDMCMGGGDGKRDNLK